VKIQCSERTTLLGQFRTTKLTYALEQSYKWRRVPIDSYSYLHTQCTH
jgi:hypothetical protein